jgi:hypothetical protein
VPPRRDATGRFVKGGGTMPAYVRVDGAAVAQILRDPNGPMARQLLIDGEIVRQGARRRVGVYRPRPGPTRRRRPGTLRDSIIKRLAIEGTLVVFVGSYDNVALLHHEGTVPHTILPRNAKWLVFYSERVGRVVYVKRVHHPGTRPNRYLTDALGDVGR